MHDHIKTKATCIANQDKRKNQISQSEVEAFSYRSGQARETVSKKIGDMVVRCFVRKLGPVQQNQNSTEFNEQKKKTTKQRGTTKRRRAIIVLICLKHVPNQWCNF